MVIPGTLKAVQIAYFVNDIFDAAERMARTFGAGPFIVSEHIELSSCLYRGKEVPFDHSSAYGQYGNVMMELVQQNNEGLSPFRDMYGPGEEGLHHVAVFAEDLHETLRKMNGNGYETASLAVTRNGGVEFAFVDATKDLGHMIEVYEPTDMLTGFYDMVRHAADGWNGRDVFISPS